MGAFTNSEDPDEMLHYFHQGLHCLLKIKTSSDKKNNVFLCFFLFFFFLRKPDTPRYVQWTIPSLLYQTRRKNPVVYKGLKFRILEVLNFHP